MHGASNARIAGDFSGLGERTSRGVVLALRGAMHDDPFLPFATALPSPGGGGARDELAAGPRRRTIDLARRVPDVVLALPSLGRLRVETGNAVARVEGAGDYTQLRFLGDVARVVAMAVPP
ncbi:MAG: hypothetical protein KC464_08580, partial [Myxococcales bacterium]|nr:hypothetical protein [Myxococcales bacterium]